MGVSKVPQPLPAIDLTHVLDHGADLWPRLAGTRIFITGATGFFGKWLLECLLHANSQFQLRLQLTALSRQPEAFLQFMPHLSHDPALRWIKGDVTNFAFPDTTFTHIIHAATEASAELNRSHPLGMFDTIVTGTRRVLELAVASDKASILLTSSGAVYGRQPPTQTRTPEDYTGSPVVNTPDSAYAEGKRAAEQLCAIYAREHGISPRIARCYAFLGPHLPLDSHFAAGNFIRDALCGATIRIKGDGTPYRSYLYAADLVVWLLKILLDGAPNRPYNVGSDQAISITDLAHAIAEAAGGGELQIGQEPSACPAERYIPSIARARSELGLDVWIPLPEALKRTLAWLHHSSSPSVDGTCNCDKFPP